MRCNAAPAVASPAAHLVRVVDRAPVPPASREPDRAAGVVDRVALPKLDLVGVPAALPCRPHRRRLLRRQSPRTRTGEPSNQPCIDSTNLQYNLRRLERPVTDAGRFAFFRNTQGSGSTLR